MTNEQKAAKTNAILAARRAVESPEERARRMAGAHSDASRKAQRATQRAKGAASEAARDWRLESPAGVVYTFRNLAHFVRSNPHLFSPRELEPVNRRGMTRIEAALSWLSPRRKVRSETAHGWRWASPEAAAGF